MDARSATVVICLFIAVMIVVLGVLYLRYRNSQLLHHERMVALEKGTAVPIPHTLAPWSPRVYLLRGLLWSFSGVALMIFLLGTAASTHQPTSAVSTMWRVQRLAQNANISLDEARKIVEKDNANSEQGMPFGVALLGFIPLGVGLAYLVFYYTDESRKKGVARPELRQ